MQDPSPLGRSRTSASVIAGQEEDGHDLSHATPRDAAIYISEMTGALRHIASQHKLRELVYILGVAEQMARTEVA